jgi:Holliday junction resolvasome RuvABC endonuclease subunit
MTILALDLGTTTGWALQGTPILYGVWNLKGGRYEGGGMRFVRFRHHLETMHHIHPITCIAYEEVRRHMGVDAAHIYGGLQAVLTSWCESEKIPYASTPVGTIKKFATGKGNAGKPEMLKAIRAKGYKPADDNEADALALLLCVMGERKAA